MSFNRPYKAADRTNQRYNLTSSRVREDKILESDYEYIITRAKNLGRNNFLVSAILDTMQTYVLGNGITPIGISKTSGNIWSNWITNAHIDGVTTFYKILSNMITTLCITDFFIYFPEDSQSEISFKCATADSSRVRTPDQYKNGELTIRGGVIDFGIEKVNGKIVGYWVNDSEDNSSNDESDFVFMYKNDPNTGRLNAYLVKSPNPEFTPRTRSLPIFTNIIPEIEDLQDLSDAIIQSGLAKSKLSVIGSTKDPKLMAQAMNAAKTIITDQGEETEIRSNGLSKIGDVENGSIFLAPPGIDWTTISHSGNADIVKSQTQSLRHAAAGVTIPLEILLSNFEGINFSGGKLSQDKFFRLVEYWRLDLSPFLNEVFKNVMIEGYKVLDLDPLREDTTGNNITPKQWQGQGKPDLNPSQTANANKTDLELGIVSKSEICAKRGKNYSDVVDQREQDNELENNNQKENTE